LQIDNQNTNFIQNMSKMSKISKKTKKLDRFNILIKQLFLFSLFFGLFSSSFFSVFTSAQNPNPINLGIVAVDKDGQRISTRAVNSQEYIFDGILTDSDNIRYQYSGVDLALRYLNIAASGGGYLQVYKDQVSEENFILNAGRENYPLAISELSSRLRPGSNTLLFVYKNSGNNKTYNPVSFTFQYQTTTKPASIKVLSPARQSVFGQNLDNTVVLELENYRLSSSDQLQAGVGKMLVYYNQVSPETKLGTVTSSQDLGDNKQEVRITSNQIDFSKIPDSEETNLIFVLADASEKPLGVQTNLNIRTNFNNSIQSGLPSVSILEPRKDRTDLKVTPDTKFILKVENFNLLKEIKEIGSGEEISNTEGYLQIYVDQGNFTIPLQTSWPKLEFTLRELGYVPEKGKNSDDIMGSKTIKVQLVNVEFETLKPSATDSVEIFYEPELTSPENETVVENNIWRLVMIGFTVILIVGVILILIIKG
jgi:hypothetical protein